MRLLHTILFILLIGLPAVPAVGQYPRISALQADSICQTLEDMSVTTEVYDVTGVMIGINHAQLYAPLIVGEMQLEGETSMDVFRLANFDSASFVRRDDLGFGDTVTIRTRLSKYKGISTCHYGYLLEVHKFIDPIPGLLMRDKAQQWSLAMEEERNAVIKHTLWMTACLVLLVISLMVAWGFFIRKVGEHDTLTGLYNRYGGLRRMAYVFRHKTCGYFCVMDLDKFHQFNTEYNNEVGDAYLTAFGRLMHTYFKSHIPIRLGGDEFAVYVKTESEVELRQLMEGFFQQVREIHMDDVTLSYLSVSVGAAYYGGSKDENFDVLYQRADAQLYQSKTMEGSTLSV